MNSTTHDIQPNNAWISQYHAALGQMASRRMAEEIERGAWVGRIPLGYVAGRNGSTKIEVDPEKAEQIRLAFGLAASPRASLRDVLQKMTALGLTGHRGKAIGLSSLHHILSNPFYAGLIRYKGELLPGNHPAVISSEIFERVQCNLFSRRWGQKAKR